MEDEIVTPGETDYISLFENNWCPLLGLFPGTGSMSYTQTDRGIDIIRNARTLWGIKPFRRYEVVEDDQPKELHKYPQWKIDIAQDILRIHPQVKKEADIIETDDGIIHKDQTFDLNWIDAVGIVKESIKPRLNEQIIDYHILAILAIAEAWDALKNVLYYKKSEDNPDVLKRVQAAAGLFAKAQELASKKLIEDNEQVLQNKEDDIKKRDVTITALQRDLIEKHDVVHYSETKEKESKQQTKPKGIIHVDVPSGTKWSSIKIGIDCCNEKLHIKIGDSFKNIKFLDIGLIDGRSKKNKRTDLLDRLIEYAAAENNVIYIEKMAKNYKKVKSDTTRLSKMFSSYFKTIEDGPPISYITGEGFKSKFGKLYLIDKDYYKPSEVTTNELEDISDRNSHA